MPRSRSCIVLLLLLVLAAYEPRSFSSAESARAQTAGQLNVAFQQAATEFDVPRDILVTIAYIETRFDDHDGKPSIDNGYGLMHLAQNPSVDTLGRAAALLGVSQQVLKTDSVQNIRGGAALMRAYADEQGLSREARQNLANWYEVAARYSNSINDLVIRDYANEMYRLLNAGFAGRSPDGETISVSSQTVQPNKGRYAGVASRAAQSPDYPGALWAPAHSSNYKAANRTQDYPIKYIVIHTTQGSYNSAINWFGMDHGSAGPTSAHYVIRSRDGEITQTVREKDIAYHAGNWTYNTQAIGIEHEGWINDPNAWYTDAMYRASAVLTRHIAEKYNIPLDRSRIIGHNEVPGATHTDPGSGWNWNYYMQLVTQAAPSDNGDSVIDEQESRFTSTGSWKIRSCGYSGRTYWTYATNGSEGVASTNVGTWRPNLPKAGRYKLLAYVPQGCGIATPPYASTSARYKVYASGSTTSATVTVDQNTSQDWVDLGTYQFDAGTAGKVELTDLTNDPFSAQKVVFFDALQWVYQEPTTPPPVTSAQLVSARALTNVVAVGSVVQVELKIKNTGTTTIETQAPDGAESAGASTGWEYPEWECYLNSETFQKQAGRLRATLGFADGSAKVTSICSGDDGGYPWRWGVRAPLKPGETRTMIGYVRFYTSGTYTLEANLVNEYVKYYGIDGNGTSAKIGPITVKDFPYRMQLPLTQR